MAHPCPPGPACSRRAVLAATGAALAHPAAARAPRLQSFDDEMRAYMSARGVPGGALAVVRGQRLVYARGYGVANRETGEPVTPRSLFRLASISKPLTAVAVLRLVEEERLRLHDRAFSLLALPEAPRDPRLHEITVAHLLYHAGGWDREASFDPMFRSREIAAELGLPCPPGPAQVVRYMLRRPLDFDPGSRYAYSNFGYCVLGRIIEQVTGAPYQEYVRALLARAGIRGMRLGATRRAARAAAEVCYYTREEELAESLFPEGPRQVPEPYGSFYLEAMDAHGGWIGCALDLARFAACFHSPDHCPLLHPDTLRRMHSRPPAPLANEPDGTEKDHYYALGWLVRPTANGACNAWHAGSLPGTFTLLVRRHDGLSWVALFNQRGSPEGMADSDIDPAMHRAAAAVTHWPRGELLARR